MKRCLVLLLVAGCSSPPDDFSHLLEGAAVVVVMPEGRYTLLRGYGYDPRVPPLASGRMARVIYDPAPYGSEPIEPPLNDWDRWVLISLDGGYDDGVQGCLLRSQLRER